MLKIEKVLKLWRMRNFTVKGKIAILKMLAISKIIYLFLITNFPTIIINELNKIQKELYVTNLKMVTQKLWNFYPRLPA